MIKRITLAAVKREIGFASQHNILSDKQAFYMVLGASEVLGDKAFRMPRVSEVQYPSNAELKKLSRQIWTRR